MKNFKIIALIMLAGTMLFSSCAKDEETIAAPTITFQNGNDALVFDGTVGIDVRVDITAEGKVSSFKYTDGTNVTDIDASGETTFSYDFMVSAADLTVAMEGKEELIYTFTLVDKENNTREAVYTVTRPAIVAGAITEYTAVLMGGQDNANDGSFLATTTGMVYLKNVADQNSELIDIIYYYGSTNQATFCAPNDVTVNGGTGNLDLATGLSTQNATKFVKADNIVWADVTDDALLVDIADINSTKITTLAVGDILAFETAAGKIGILKVTAKTDGATGSITIEVKVQE